jgi:hypothetical protein
LPLNGGEGGRLLLVSNQFEMHNKRPPAEAGGLFVVQLVAPGDAVSGISGQFLADT